MEVQTQCVTLVVISPQLDVSRNVDALAFVVAEVMLVIFALGCYVFLSPRTEALTHPAYGEDLRRGRS